MICIFVIIFLLLCIRSVGLTALYFFSSFFFFFRCFVCLFIFSAHRRFVARNQIFVLQCFFFSPFNGILFDLTNHKAQRRYMDIPVWDVRGRILTHVCKIVVVMARKTYDIETMIPAKTVSFKFINMSIQNSFPLLGTVPIFKLVSSFFTLPTAQTDVPYAWIKPCPSWIPRIAESPSPP